MKRSNRMCMIMHSSVSRCAVEHPFSFLNAAAVFGSGEKEKQLSVLLYGCSQSTCKRLHVVARLHVQTKGYRTGTRHSSQVCDACDRTRRFVGLCSSRPALVGAWTMLEHPA
eukprot:3921953-Prymnesium_polylepis.1